MIVRYFAVEQKTIDELETQRKEIVRQTEEMAEEYSGEEGLLEQLKNNKGKITKGNVQDRVLELKKEILESSDTSDGQKELAKKIKKDFVKVNWQKGIKDELEYFAELDVLRDYLELINTEAYIKKQIKTTLAELNTKLVAKYKALTETEIKSLVVDDKWLATMEHDVKTEMDRISLRLTGRIKELTDRYETPLPQQHKEVNELTAKVDAHLQKMGFAWN